jgi:hypothetical protein
MAQATQSIEVPVLPVRACSVSEHCEALRAGRQVPFWWYLGRHPILGNFSRPFRDRRGTWWYQVKPGLCWAPDCFAPLSPQEAQPPFAKSYLGYQHVVPSDAEANSHLVINAITDLTAYDEKVVDAKRRNAIRKGLRSCALELLTAYDEPTVEQCRLAWKDLTERTGWKHALQRDAFHATWPILLDYPGVSILIGRDLQSGQVAGFLVTKIIGDTAYVDTIASRTDSLKCNVNDAIMFTFLMNARRLTGVTKAHYAIRSYVQTLESFKRGLGFQPVAFPARTVLRGPVRLILKRFFPDKYRRMHGLFETEDGQPPAACETGGRVPTP